ncbi:MAG: hypothetical protein KZQ93_04720 [Candidatus Thiodiazotropha sp. (ex Monitilora ramsayi)]|nr:hypothetical protein [Candidatus Thiodiazotropha sp. (ex Monitilora ramsayi)]
MKLPADWPIFTAYHFEVVDVVQGQKSLDFVVILRLNKSLLGVHIVTSSLLGYESFYKAVQRVIEKSRSGVRDDGGKIIHINSPCQHTGVLPENNRDSLYARPNRPIAQ